MAGYESAYRSLLDKYKRVITYLAVGGTCFFVQFVLLSALVHLDLYRPAANAVAFITSAQINFYLSAQLTWRDRPSQGWRRNIGRWSAYNVTALLSLGLDSAVFFLVYRRVGTIGGAALGVVAATSLTYLICNKVIFRRSGLAGRRSSLSPLPARGQIEAVRSEGRDGITVILPAYREEANLAATVRDMLGGLQDAGEPHHVVIVNDGSPDRTGAVAEELAVAYPGRVRVVHHEVNRGYGAAVRTGIQQALDTTDSRRLFLTDADGQFSGADLPKFVDVARHERADAVIGFRINRADPPLRKLNALLWGWACRLLLGIRARDVDCAYKLIDRRVLDGLDLRGDAGAISPELLLRLRDRGARLLQRPVQHYPRLHGEQTGADPSVIIASLGGLLRLWLKRTRRRWPGRRLSRLVHPRDPVLAVVTVLSVAASASAGAYFAGRGLSLAYPDTISHLLIARRVLDASTPGAAQLGAVWLPLPHLLTLPFVWINSWYYSGLAGSLVSMLSYVLITRYLYRTAHGMTGSRVAGIVAALIFAANPNVLYLQSTPMTELLLLACIAAMVYHLMRWCQDRSYRQLGAASAAALLASLARYEGWVLAVAAAAVVAAVAWQRSAGGRLGDRLHQVEGHLTFYGVVAFSGIAGWVLWNAVIFHNALDFQDGSFAKPSLWVSRSDVAIGHWRLAAETYFYAMADNVGWAALGVAGIGLAYYLFRTRLRADTLAPVVLLVIIPFYVYALYAGQRPLHVTQISGSLYNVRFGILTVLPVALFVGYLASAVQHRASRWARSVGYAMLCGAAVAMTVTVAAGGIDTLKEPQVFQASASQQANLRAARWLRGHYHSGAVLMESFGNETVTFGSHIPLQAIIYEGSYRQWAPTLQDPLGHGIKWIYMRRTRGDADEVWTTLHSSPQLRRYRLVYADQDRLIYRERQDR